MIDQTSALDKQIRSIGEAARAAARSALMLSADDRTTILHAMADALLAHAEVVREANWHDMDAATAAGLSAAMLDRLRLDQSRIDAMADGLRVVAELPNPLGEVIKTIRHDNGMTIEKTRVPLGVIGMIYESRPNVTADAAGLCFKAGNAVILRGGSEACESNRAILEAIVSGGVAHGMPDDAIQLIPTTDRAAVRSMLRLDDCIDLIIPRGGESLIRTVAEASTIPVLKHYKGVCHVYVDRAADLDMAERIIVNGKCQRPGVCNAIETLLVHQDVADAFLPRIAYVLRSKHVELRGDARTRDVVDGVGAADESDWSTEYLDLILAVAIVDDLESAVAHIETHGSHHSDVIVTENEDAARRFTQAVDSATVYVNASSRFTDGYEFGMGAEIGISTDKLHARGPCGIEELTTYKYVVRGTGQVRS